MYVRFPLTVNCWSMSIILLAMACNLPLRIAVTIYDCVHVRIGLREPGNHDNGANNLWTLTVLWCIPLLSLLCFLLFVTAIRFHLSSIQMAVNHYCSCFAKKQFRSLHTTLCFLSLLSHACLWGGGGGGASCPPLGHDFFFFFFACQPKNCFSFFGSKDLFFCFVLLVVSQKGASPFSECFVWAHLLQTFQHG